jgi:NAD(P)-dependent dehydrogenase (short-subunit alcohol dehydrogenase family)
MKNRLLGENDRADGEFAGHVALITGAGDNLGRAVTEELARRGAAVGILVRSNRRRAESVADKIRSAGGRATVLVGDVADASVVKQLVAHCHSELGPITVLVHCATYRSVARFHELPLEEWRRAISVILDGAFHVIQAVLPDMMASGFGRVVLIGGSALSSGLPVGHGHVAAAKAGLCGVARNVAQEYGAYGITANVLSPGPIETVYKRGVAPELIERLTAETSVGRVATIDEVVAACVFLAAPLSGMITGQVIAIDGGLRGLNP